MRGLSPWCQGFLWSDHLRWTWSCWLHIRWSPSFPSYIFKSTYYQGSRPLYDPWAACGALASTKCISNQCPDNISTAFRVWLCPRIRYNPTTILSSQSKTFLSQFSHSYQSNWSYSTVMPYWIDFAYYWVFCWSKHDSTWRHFGVCALSSSLSMSSLFEILYMIL